MSFTKETTIWCDKCAHWEQKSKTTTKIARRLLKRQGWKFVDGKDYCPNCDPKSEVSDEA